MEDHDTKKVSLNRQQLALYSKNDLIFINVSDYFARTRLFYIMRLR